MTHIARKTSCILGLLVLVLLFIVSASFVSADTSRARGGQNPGEDRRGAALTKVLETLENVVPEQAQSPEAVADALARETGNNTEEDTEDESGGSPAPEANANANTHGNNGGAESGNGGNGGNANPGGLVRAGSVVSNATAVNAINTVIVRIHLR